MKLICTHCRTFLKKHQTKIYRELIRMGTSNVHIPTNYRVCNKCGTEVYDYRLEKQNIKNYVKQYKFIQKQEVRHAK